MKLSALLMFLFFLQCTELVPVAPGPENSHRTATPPLGWNSYDCWFWMINDSIIRDNLSAFEKKLKPAGYEYFVLDDGWQYGSGDGSMTPHIDSFGRSIPDPHRFPNGLRPFVEDAHTRGIKFGIWLIRGAPKDAISRKLKIKGTQIAFESVLDTTVRIDPFLGVSSWHSTSAFRENSVGIQEYYNSVFELLAEWEIDFVKYDYVSLHRSDIAAITAARDRCGRNIIVSLSPSAGPYTALFPEFSRADMVRITTDVWDNRESLYKGFDQWLLWQPYSSGFWLDLDMIPFGTFPLYSRTDSFSLAQKQTFMTQRALAASPLFFGGSLPESDSTSIALVTDRDMLECNQNGVCGTRWRTSAKYDVWGTVSAANSKKGWIGVFNNTQTSISEEIGISALGLDPAFHYTFFDIWNKKVLKTPPVSLLIDPDGVVFIRYQVERRQKTALINR